MIRIVAMHIGGRPHSIGQTIRHKNAFGQASIRIYAAMRCEKIRLLARDLHVTWVQITLCSVQLRGIAQSASTALSAIYSAIAEG
jgi:hypothetical protein